MLEPRHATTILSVRKGKQVVVIGDGQVSQGPTVIKGTAKKVRLLAQGNVIAGFAGATADCFALMERLERKLEEYPGQLLRASIELAKLWRTDKALRHLEASLIAVDKDISLELTGNGDVIAEPQDGIFAIGSGSLYAVSAARALIDLPEMNAMDVAKKSMKIAADICVYTNHNWTIESLNVDPDVAASEIDRAAARKAEADLKLVHQNGHHDEAQPSKE